VALDKDRIRFIEIFKPFLLNFLFFGHMLPHVRGYSGLTCSDNCLNNRPSNFLHEVLVYCISLHWIAADDHFMLTVLEKKKKKFFGLAMIIYNLIMNGKARKAMAFDQMP
jgi:hypothetical protein